MSLPSSASMNNFLQQGRLDAIKTVHEDLVKLLAVVPEDRKEEATKDLPGYQQLFQQYIVESDKKEQWDKILPPDATMIKDYSHLEQTSDKDEIKRLLSKLVVLKLNGGLGTSMGCEGPKSAIFVRDDMTFLDLTVRQIEFLNMKYDVDVPLILMNSFNTHKQTMQILRKYQSARCKILCFNQSCYPRILRDGLRPVPLLESVDDSEAWYPPGHGDLYQSLENSGILARLLEDKKEHIFVSNIDNLGATVDLTILHHLEKNPSCEFVMEVTDKTRADVKGGTLINYEGQVRLLEIAQVPKDKVSDFLSVSKFRIFNTNNLWISLPAIKRLLDAHSIHMEVIENKKTLENGASVIQLERAVGSAIKNFKNAIGINVPRSRFLPVKKTSDLLLVMSNLYQLQQGSLVMNPNRNFLNVPLIKLGDEHFAKVKNFQKRFENIPNIMELDHLTVTGDVMFGSNITLRGTVIVIANHGERIDIPSGSVLDNKIVTGSLRILDH